MMFVKLIKQKMKLKFNGFLVLLVVLAAQLTLQERAVSGTVSDNARMPYQV
jgi:hypothetical protein